MVTVNAIFLAKLVALHQGGVIFTQHTEQKTQRGRFESIGIQSGIELPFLKGFNNKSNNF